MSASSTRTLLANGDMYAWLTSMDPDEIQTVRIEVAGTDTVIGGTYARIGATQVALGPDGEVQVHTHDTAQDAAACFTWNSQRIATLAQAARGGPQSLMAAMVAAETVGVADLLDGVQPAGSDLPQRAPGATLDGSGYANPTGMYL